MHATVSVHTVCTVYLVSNWRSQMVSTCIQDILKALSAHDGMQEGANFRERSSHQKHTSMYFSVLHPSHTYYSTHFLPAAPVMNCDWLAEGQQLVTASWDHTAKLWDFNQDKSYTYWRVSPLQVVLCCSLSARYKYTLLELCLHSTHYLLGHFC